MSQDIQLTVRIGRLTLPNPILVASGTFGYAREMQNLVDTGRLGGILPKTITAEPRLGNAPPRTVETTAGLLNSIGLDNDGLDAFLAEKMPALAAIGVPILISIAGRQPEEFIQMTRRLEKVDGVTALELNLSCPNVTGGIDYGTDPESCRKLIACVREACELPILAKLTPNVTDITEMAQAAADGGADGVSLINTCLGMAIDWRNRKPRLGNILGGLSGPAIKPIALRMVYQVAQAVAIPIVGIGGIETIDDAMEFFLAGATAVQIGTASFYRPRATMEILDALPETIGSLGAGSIQEIVGTLRV